MLSLLTLKTFNCLTSYAIETIEKSSISAIQSSFEDLPKDPYLTGGYRFRRFSRFEVVEGQLKQLPHSLFYQSDAFNALLGNIQRDYAELDDALIQLDGFKRAVMTFWDFCQRCSPLNTIGVHQIRITASNQEQGNPAPEGLHQDGVDMVGVLCIDRTNIVGGETQLYPSQQSSPIFQKILNPGELLVFNDHQFFHFTTPVKPAGDGIGTRDVFVFTCPNMPFETDASDLKSTGTETLEQD